MGDGDKVSEVLPKLNTTLNNNGSSVSRVTKLIPNQICYIKMILI